MLSSMMRFLFRREQPHVPQRTVRRHRPAPAHDGTIHERIPALDNYGLMSIEARIARGVPARQLQRWIDEVEQQLPTMQPAVRQYAKDLLLKLHTTLNREQLQPLRTPRTR